MRKLLFFATYVTIPLVMMAAPAWAGPLDKALGNLNTAVGSTGLQPDLSASVGTVIKGMLALVGTIFLVLTIYAGIIWMTASGEEEKVTKAKNIIQATVIGLVITMSAYAITFFVTSRLGG